jgi:hypothetical protein
MIGGYSTFLEGFGPKICLKLPGILATFAAGLHG